MSLENLAWETLPLLNYLYILLNAIVFFLLLDNFALPEVILDTSIMKVWWDVLMEIKFSSTLKLGKEW